MYNRYMSKEQLAVKVGDRVRVYGWEGTVTEVFHNKDTEWNGKEYEEIADSDSTAVKIHFDDPKSIGYQYQDGVYGNFSFIK